MLRTCAEKENVPPLTAESVDQSVHVVKTNKIICYLFNYMIQWFVFTRSSHWLMTRAGVSPCRRCRERCCWGLSPPRRLRTGGSRHKTRVFVLLTPWSWGESCWERSDMSYIEERRDREMYLYERELRDFPLFTSIVIQNSFDVYSMSVLYIFVKSTMKILFYFIDVICKLLKAFFSFNIFYQNIDT